MITIFIDIINTLLHFCIASDGRLLSNMIIYITIGCSVLIMTGTSVFIVLFCCRKSVDSPDGKKG